MAKRTSIKASKVQVAFEAISIEGGLLSPEWLSKIAQLQADAQAPADYKIPKGLTLRDEIGRYWRIAEALWNDYRSKSEGLTDTAKLTESFVVTLLTQCLGFDDLSASESIAIGDRIYPIGFTAGGGLVPVVVSSPQEALDSLAERFGEDHRKRTAFGLLQEYLNGSDKVLWGIVCDGDTLRIVRDNASLTKPAWIEADLNRMFQELRFADFAAFWLVCHRTRFGVTGQIPEECLLENWRNSCLTDGTRARDHLRVGVEEALEILAQGFLSHPENTELREALVSGVFSTQLYFQEILRLVYRLIFLVTIEERNLLHPNQTLDNIRQLYNDGYSVRRLRDRAIKRHTFDRFSDLWESLKIVFKGLGNGEIKLGLPALGGLFADEQTPHLVAAQIENRFLLLAVLNLCWLKEDAGVSRVNWRDMGPEELGSVYESLLELVPQLTEGGHKFSFARGDETRGNARKTTGSYYTPDSLVQLLLDSALEPVIATTIRNNLSSPVEALLQLSIIDPACGSGHFLLAAARRLAGHVARLKVGGTPTAQDYRKALRQVISHCIYGVDRNPMALELSRTALWLEAMTPEAPLSFVDHHLVCGDALLGVLSLETISDGIPSDAFKALTGDDKEICKSLAIENTKKLKELKRAKLENANTLFDLNKVNLVPMLKGIEALPDDTPQAIEIKKIALENYLSVSSNASISIAADIFVCAFLAVKNSTTKNLVPTTDDLMRALRGTLPLPNVIVFIKEIAAANRVLHWQLKFSQVFSKGGFDVVVGNPPWERIKLQEQEFFSVRDPVIAGARTKDERVRLINALHLAPSGSPENNLFKEFEKAKHDAEASSVYCRESRRYPLSGVGDINTYALFSETCINLISSKGRVGIIVPSGISTDSTTKAFFQHISDSNKLVSLFGFDNQEKIFPAVHPDTPFCLMTLGFANGSAKLASYLLNVQHLQDKRRSYSLSDVDLRLINPNTRTCPAFRSERDAEITKKIYSRVPVISPDGQVAATQWQIEIGTMFHMSNDSSLFRSGSNKGELLDPVPLYESKFIHQYNHRWATCEGDEVRDTLERERLDSSFEITPQYWVDRNEVETKLSGKNWHRPWLMGFRFSTNPTNERTVIASVFPRAGVSNMLPLLFIRNEAPRCLPAFILGALNSIPFDYVARQKMTRAGLNDFIFRQLPMPGLETLTEANIAFVVSRVCQLTGETNWSRVWIEDLGVGDMPITPGDSHKIRSEIDAYFAALFGLNREELRFILCPSDVEGVDYPSETFRVLREREIRASGEFRTGRLVLEAWDRLEECGELPGVSEGKI